MSDRQVQQATLKEMAQFLRKIADLLDKADAIGHDDISSEAKLVTVEQTLAWGCVEYEFEGSFTIPTDELID